ncbi:DUF2911 domain-containing protein [Halalkalibaculum sp. DA384]|uniref:DUF2911 domain-containing protein n=1 Tax=Halalkalibaculum sp. DA384 TaxID=3373606 RepID=UPI0037548E2E
MKSFLVSVSLSFALMFAFAYSASAQERATNEARVSPNASVSQTIGTTQVTITYGRPSVKGRQVFGGLEPYGSVWRTGANEATTIRFSDDVLIEGEPLQAGTYGLFTVPGEDEWVVIFNNVPNQWGAFDYDSSEDALRVKVSPEEAHHIEQLMFYFEDVTSDSGTAVVHWSTIKVPFTIESAS